MANARYSAVSRSSCGSRRFRDGHAHPRPGRRLIPSSACPRKAAGLHALAAVGHPIVRNRPGGSSVSSSAVCAGAGAAGRISHRHFDPAGIRLRNHRCGRAASFRPQIAVVASAAPARLGRDRGRRWTKGADIPYDYPRNRSGDSYHECGIQGARRPAPGD